MGAMVHAVATKTALSAMLAAAFVMLLFQSAGAAALPWEFTPPHLGRALTEGGWAETKTLAIANGSPEFTFPIQLVYLSSRSERGQFGDQWFCPQLESHVLPKATDVLVWQTPAGGVIGLFAQKNNARKFATRTGDWQATTTGLAVTISSADGWQYLYSGGRIQTVVSPIHREISFTYKGQLLSQVVLRDAATGASQVLVSVVEKPDGKIANMSVCGVEYAFAYQNGFNGRLAMVSQPAVKAVTTFGYDKGGVLNEERTPRGLVVSLRSEQTKDKAGHDEKVAPTNSLPVTRLLEDEVYHYTYEQSTVKVQDKSGATISLDNAVNRGVQTSTDTAGHQSKTYYYRAPGQKYDGKPRRVEQDGAVVSDYLYSKESGNLIESKDKDGVITFYEYAQQPAGAPNSLQYSKPVRIYQGTRKAKKLIATLQYDQAGNLTQQIEAGKTTRFSYDARGQLISFINPDGERTNITYDAFGRRTGVAKINTPQKTSVAKDGSSQENISYDENGRVKSRLSPDGQKFEIAYDSQGAVLSVKQNGVQVVQYQRGSSGEVVAQTDALGRTTQLDRDQSGNVVAIHQPNGATTFYEYDQAGHRKAQIDGNGNRITFEYDLAGHLIKQTNALGQMLTWSFDPKGHLIQRTNGIQNITYRYNDAGRLTLLDYGKVGEKIRYSYDEKNRPKKISTPTNSITLYYDKENRVIARQFTRRTATDRVIRYEYDDTGRKTSVVLSEKETASKEKKSPGYRLIQQTEYAYDAAGELTSISSNGATVCSYVYDPHGRLIQRTYGNGIVGKYGYDAFGRMIRLDLSSGGGMSNPMSLVYEWDDASQLRSRTWNGETQVYSYDPSGQLTSVTAISQDGKQPSMQPVSNPQPSPSTRGVLLESYRYDAAGNMLEKLEEGTRTIMTYDTANQLQTAESNGVIVRFQYDLAGRLLSESDLVGESRQYGLLDKMLVLTKADGTRLGYDYYPDGQLAAKGPLTRDTTKGASDGAGLLQQASLKMDDAELQASEIQKSMNVKEELVWDGLALFYRNGETFAIEPHPSGGVPVASTNDPQSGSNTYYVNDILGTTLMVVHPNGVEIVPLTAFGKPRGTNVPDVQGAARQDSQVETVPSKGTTYSVP